MNRIKLFHGTDHIIEVPDIGTGNPRNDYGKGFYCTRAEEMAREWACKKNTNGFVNAYNIDTYRSDIKKSKAYQKKELPNPTYPEERSPEYWAGWAVAEYQWYTGRCFSSIFQRIPLTKVISMYHVYHEMDITNFIDTINALYQAAEGDTNLKRIRENRGLSQTELADKSGVNLRNIQMYEQRHNSIDKAQAQILYKLSRVLGCEIEELLENPMM